MKNEGEKNCNVLVLGYNGGGIKKKDFCGFYSGSSSRSRESFTYMLDEEGIKAQLFDNAGFFQSWNEWPGFFDYRDYTKIVQSIVIGIDITDGINIPLKEDLDYLLHNLKANFPNQTIFIIGLYNSRYQNNITWLQEDLQAYIDVQGLQTLNFILDVSEPSLIKSAMQTAMNGIILETIRLNNTEKKELQKNAYLLIEGKMQEESPLSQLPEEVLVKIASLTVNDSTPEEQYKLADRFFGIHKQRIIEKSKPVEEITELTSSSP